MEEEEGEPGSVFSPSPSYHTAHSTDDDEGEGGEARVEETTQDSSSAPAGAGVDEDGDGDDGRAAEGSLAPLGEGDFFPGVEDLHTVEEELEKTDGVLSSSSRGSSVSASEAETPAKPLTAAAELGRRPRRKRQVLWVDDQALAAADANADDSSGHRGGVEALLAAVGTLVTHHRDFFLPQGSGGGGNSSSLVDFASGLMDPGSPLSAGGGGGVGQAPTSIFKEKRNSDGSVYLSARAQMPSPKYREWARAAGRPQAPPFPLPVQPYYTPKASKTLLEALVGGSDSGNSGSSVARGVRVHKVTVARRSKRLPQMPFIRLDTAGNEPYVLPTTTTTSTNTSTPNHNDT